MVGGEAIRPSSSGWERSSPLTSSATTTACSSFRRSMNHEKANPKNYNLFRLLLTDSKRYMLPLYGDVTVKMDLNNIKNFLCQVMRKSRSQWNDVNQRSRQSGSLTIYKRRGNHLMSNRDVTSNYRFNHHCNLPQLLIPYHDTGKSGSETLQGDQGGAYSARSADWIGKALIWWLQANFRYGWDLAA